MLPPEQEIMERAADRAKGVYFEKYGYRPIPSKYGPLTQELSAIRHAVNSAISLLPEHVRDGVLLLTRATIGNVPRLDQAPMAVWLEPSTGTIRLGVNVHWMDIISNMCSEGRVKVHSIGINAEIKPMILHELWHVLKGHNYLPPDKMIDPIWKMAMEISINDGHLKDTILNITYPVVSARTMGIMSEMEQEANRLGLPNDWLLHDHMVYRVLVNLNKDKLIKVEVKTCTCNSGTGQQDDSQQEGTPHKVVVVTNVGTGKRYEYHEWQMGGDAMQTDDQGDVDHVHKNIIDVTDSKWKYDPTTRSFSYDSSAPQDADRYILPTATVIPWHRIRTLLEIKRVLGYNRRIGHSLPPECQKLTTRSFKKRSRIAVFIDSSGSISNEVISAFINTVRASPYNVEVKFFSTQVLDKPHTGGTDFKCIEDYLINDETNNGKRYPKTVLVLTDGEAPANFKPKYPKRWYWVVIGNPTVPRQIGGTVWEAKIIGGSKS